MFERPKSGSKSVKRLTSVYEVWGLQMCSMGLAAMDTGLMDEASKLVAVESIASGAILGTYEDTRFKSEVDP